MSKPVTSDLHLALLRDNLRMTVKSDLQALDNTEKQKKSTDFVVVKYKRHFLVHFWIGGHLAACDCHA